MDARRKTYDPECHTLAEYFLEYKGSDADTADLAYTIQTAVEDWLRDREDRLNTRED